MEKFAAIIEFLHRTDQNVTLFINSLNCPFSDQVWLFFTNKYVWIPLYLAVVFFLFARLGWKKGLVAVLTVALTIVACDQLSNLVKDLVARPRPCITDYMLDNGLHLLEGKSGKFGFFSAHAANAMGFAIASWRCFKWNRHISFTVYHTLTVLWAVLVGLSRVFVGKHYFGDVLVGLLVGWLVALIISGITGKIAGRISRR